MRIKTAWATLGVAAIAFAGLMPIANPATAAPSEQIIPAIAAADLSAVAVSDEAPEEPDPNGEAAAAVDGDVNTFWHSAYLPAEKEYPHWISVQPYQGEDLKSCNITGLNYFQRQGGTGGGAKNGILGGYEVYASDTKPKATADLTGSLATGTFVDKDEVQSVTFNAVDKQFITLKATSTANTDPAKQKLATIGELQLQGYCTTTAGNILVRPIAPTQSDDKASVNLPNVRGVEWKVNGTAATGTATLQDGNNTVTATAKDGYTFPKNITAAETSFSFTYDGAPLPVTIPELSGDFQRGQGEWKLTPTTQVVRSAEMSVQADLLVAELNEYLKAESQAGTVEATEQGSGIKVVVDSSRAGTLAQEGYELKIEASGVTITGATKVGAFYGTRTLSQMLRQQLTLPAGTVVDKPQYAERGVTMCACVINTSTDWIDRLLTDMADLKLNQMLIELKVKSEKYPETNTYSYYTPEDVRQLVEKAKDYGIDVIPEINSPGHMDVWLENKQDFMLPTGSKRVNQLDVTKPEAIQFYKDLIDEYDDVFNTQYWHLGADEYMMGDSYSNHPELAAFAKEKFGAQGNAEDTFIWFINQINDYVKTKKGPDGNPKILRMWNDGYISGATQQLDKDIVVEYWNSAGRNVIDVVNDNYKVMNAHLNWYWSRPGSYPMNYNLGAAYNTAPNSFPSGTLTTDAQKQQQTGVKASIWPDDGTIVTENEYEEEIYPGLRVISQIAWDGGKASDASTYDQFKASRIDKIGRSPMWENVNRTPIDPRNAASGSFSIKQVGSDGVLSLLGAHAGIDGQDSFKLVQTPDQYYQLKSVASGKCLGVYSGDSHLGVVTQVGVQIEATDCADVSVGKRASGAAQRNPQKWQIIETDTEGQYVIRNAVTQQNLAVASGKENHVDFKADRSRAPKAGAVVQFPADMTDTTWEITPFDAPFSVTSSVDAGTVHPGEDTSKATITVTVTNDSDAPLSNITVTPPARHAGWSITPASHQIDSIPVGESKEVKFFVASQWILGAKNFIFDASDGVNKASTAKEVASVCNAQAVSPTAIAASSQETTESGQEDGRYERAVDGDSSTFWHTQYSAPAGTFPHWINLKLDSTKDICGLIYQGRSGATPNGRIKEYEVYVSDTEAGLAPGTPVSTGTFQNNDAEQTAGFVARGQYVRLQGVNSAYANGDSSVMTVAELKLLVGTVPNQLKAAVPLEPVWDESDDTYTIQAVEGIKYTVNGQEVGGKVNVAAPATVTVEATLTNSDAYYIPDDAPEQFTHAFRKAVAPTVVQFDDQTFGYEVPNDPYFDYFVGGAKLNAGDKATVGAGNSVIVDAKLKANISEAEYEVAQGAQVQFEHQFPQQPTASEEAVLTFDLGGGTLNGKTDALTIETQVGSTITIPDAPTREGYTFEYWEGSKYLPGDSYKVTGDHQFTAKWVKNSTDDPGTDEPGTDDPGTDQPNQPGEQKQADVKRTPDTGSRSAGVAFAAIALVGAGALLAARRRRGA